MLENCDEISWIKIDLKKKEKAVQSWCAMFLPTLLSKAKPKSSIANVDKLLHY